MDFLQIKWLGLSAPKNASNGGAFFNDDLGEHDRSEGSDGALLAGAQTEDAQSNIEAGACADSVAAVVDCLRGRVRRLQVFQAVMVEWDTEAKKVSALGPPPKDVHRIQQCRLMIRSRLCRCNKYKNAYGAYYCWEGCIMADIYYTTLRSSRCLICRRGRAA